MLATELHAMSLKSFLTGTTLALTALLTTTPVRAYPIDCAILLCLAGGFPPSAECAAAKATMIRRITPWPVSPPLQLWNCPLGLPAGFEVPPGFPEVRLGRDGLTDEVRHYRDAIEIFHIRTSRFGGGDDDCSDGCFTENTERGQYRDDGSHVWRRASLRHGPEWLAASNRIRRVPIRECVSWNDNGCQRWRTIRYENWPGGMSALFGNLRLVAIRYEDHEGNKHTEFVPY